MSSVNNFTFNIPPALIILLNTYSKLLPGFPSQPEDVGPTSAPRRKTERFLTSSRRRAAERLLIGPTSEMTSGRRRKQTSGRHRKLDVRNRSVFLRVAATQDSSTQENTKNQQSSQPEDVGTTSATRKKTERFLTLSQRRAAERLLIGPTSEMTSGRRRKPMSARRTLTMSTRRLFSTSARRHFRRRANEQPLSGPTSA